MKAFVILSAVMAVAVANPLPLVQIIVNVDATNTNVPPVDSVIVPPVDIVGGPEPVELPSLPIFIPKPIRPPVLPVIRPPVQPIVPPILVPEPPFEPEPVELPEPVLPGLVPEPIVVPETTLPVEVPEPVETEEPQVLPHLVAPAVIKN